MLTLVMMMKSPTTSASISCAVRGRAARNADQRPEDDHEEGSDGDIPRHAVHAWPASELDAVRLWLPIQAGLVGLIFHASHIRQLTP